MEKHSMPKSEDDNLSCQNYRRQEDYEGLEQETDINTIGQQKEENSLILANDSNQIEYSEANVTHFEGNALVEEKLLKSREETAQERVESPEKISIFQEQGLVLTAEDGNAIQDSERIERDNQSQANMVLQHKSETPAELLNSLPQAEVSHQTCEALEDNVKVKEKAEQQGNVKSVELLQTQETREKPDETLVQKLMQREQILRQALFTFCQQNQAIIQQAAVSHQENTLGSNNLVGKEFQKQRKILTPGESEDNGNEPVREPGENLIQCPSEPIDGVVERSQKDKMSSHPETKEGLELEYCGTILARVNNNESEPPQPSKGYVTLQRPKSYDAITRVQKSKDYITAPPRRVDNATVGPQKTKDYVARFPRNLDANAHSSNTKDDTTTSPKVTKVYKTLLPREPEVTVQPYKTKDYVTVQTPKLDTVTMHTPFSKDYKTLKPQKSHNATMDPPKPKDYVTVPPRDADDATTRFQKPKYHEVFIPQSEEDYTFAPSSKREDYVVLIPAGKKERTTTTTESDTPESPTHIFWPVQRFQENASVPKTPTQVREPPGSSKVNESVPESEEPHHVPVRTKKMKMVSPHLEQVLSHQCLKRLPQDDDVPLLSFVESYESVVQSNEPEVLRNRMLRALLSFLPTGIREFIRRILRRVQCFFNRWTLLCCGLLCIFLLALALYCLIIFILNRQHTI